MFGPRGTGKTSFTLELRRRAADAWKRLEKNIGINLGVVAAGVRTGGLALPPIEAEPFAAYLEHAFEATGKPIGERAVDLLVELTDAHPKRTQHLAWQVWEGTDGGRAVDCEAVHAAYDELLASTDFGGIVDGLLAGEDSDGNGAKALFLVASGASPGSRTAPPRYGLSGPDTAKRALERLRARGVVEGSGSVWRVVDPLFAEWLRRNDPLSEPLRDA